MFMEYTVAQGLKKIKLIEKRINDELALAKFVGVKKKNSDVDYFTKKKKEDFESNAKSFSESITTLINNYYELRGAIDISNAGTKLNIGDKVYTVAEAIQRQRNIELETSFLYKLKLAKKQAIEKLDLENEQINAKRDEALKAEGKDSKGRESIIDFYKNSEWELIDPLNIDDLIRKMTEDIETFKSEVDDALSTSNVMTKITVSF